MQDKTEQTPNTQSAISLQKEIWPKLPGLKLNLKLSHKGLLLVFSLLAIELIYIATLATLLQQLEYEVWRQSHARALIGKANSLIRLYYDAGAAMIGYGASRNQSFKDRYDQIFNQVPGEIRSLQLLYADTPEKNLKATKLEQYTWQGFKHLEETAAVMEDRSKILQLFMNKEDLQTQLFASFKHQVAGLNELADEQRLIEEQTPLAEERSRTNFKMCLIAGVIANIVVAILLGLSFTKGITSRLQVLIDNTIRLGKRQTLLPTLKGSDEISYLDATFHEVAKSLREAERLRQEFLSMISHDLRAPLGTVQATVQLLATDHYGQLPDKVKSVLDRCERNTNRMLQLVNDLLDIEKIEAGKWDLKIEKTTVSAIVERSVEMIQILADDKKIAITNSTAEIGIEADADRLARVMVNLLSNAIKFSPKGSTISISGGESPEWVEIKVTDQGRGIPADAIGKLFDRFQQLDIEDSTLHGGSGLGLAICKAIVEAHGGEIGVDSEVGKGSTFWIRIPRRPHEPSIV